MGVDLQTYRARIGNYANSKTCIVISNTTAVNLNDGLKNVGCFLFIGILLIMAGIEPNPGPNGKGKNTILIINHCNVCVFIKNRR